MTRMPLLMGLIGVTVLALASAGWLVKWNAALGESMRPSVQGSAVHGSPPALAHAIPPQQRLELLFGDSFPGGNPELQWEPYPFFNQDSLHGRVDPTSPTGEGGVGALANESVGGFAALSYVAWEVPPDFFLESWVHLTVTDSQTGPLNGIAFLIDPEGDRFYRLASHFTSDPELTLAYVGRDTNHFPVFVARWKADDLPGGLPSGTGWHRLGIEVVEDRAEVYWDGARLPGGPFPVDRAPPGFVGVYANFVGGLGHANTRVDDFRVWEVTSHHQ